MTKRGIALRVDEFPYPRIETKQAVMNSTHAQRFGWIKILDNVLEWLYKTKWHHVYAVRAWEIRDR